MSEKVLLSPRDALRRANMIMGVGVLLTVVPIGLSLVSLLIIDNENLWGSLLSLGWAFFICAFLLPIGLASFAMGLSRFMAAKRSIKELDEADD